jgi:hypothetical protein
MLYMRVCVRLRAKACFTTIISLSPLYYIYLRPRKKSFLLFKEVNKYQVWSNIYKKYEYLWGVLDELWIVFHN